RDGRLAGCGEARAAELDAAALGGGQGGLVRSLIVARSCSATAARMWTVSLLACGLSAAMNSTLLVHQGGDEGEVAGQAVEFGNDQLGLVLPARGQDLLELPKCAREVAAAVAAVTGVAVGARRDPHLGRERHDDLALGAVQRQQLAILGAHSGCRA